MAKVTSLNEALDKYKGSGGNDFFTLVNDKDTAIVRFLHTEADFEAPGKVWFIVHEVTINGKKRWVNCEEESDCPLCRAGNYAKFRLFLQLIDKRDGKQKIWERGRNFVSKLTGIMERKGPLYNRPYEIERVGKKGDSDTDYNLYDLDKDDKTLEDLPEATQLLAPGGFILQASYDDMFDMLDGKYTPPKQQQPQQRPQQNSSGSRQQAQSSRRQEEPQRRRETEDSTAPTDTSRVEQRTERQVTERTVEPRTTQRPQKGATNVF